MYFRSLTMTIVTKNSIHFLLKIKEKGSKKSYFEKKQKEKNVKNVRVSHPC